MICTSNYIDRIHLIFPAYSSEPPWRLTQQAEKILIEKMSTLNSEYKIFNNIAIHKTVTIDSHAIIKGPAIISPNCFVGAHAYLRGGIFLDENVSVGPGCEVKTSFIFDHTALAHFNFAGDSVIGSYVNLEAGAIIANHYNERQDKSIFIHVDGTVHPAGVHKFGALVGDHVKIGANAVLSPGTVLKPRTVVKRLELVDQAGEGK